MAKQISIEYLEYEYYYDENWKLVDKCWWDLKDSPSICIVAECVVCGAAIDPQKVLTKPLIEPLVCERCRKKEVKYENI